MRLRLDELRQVRKEAAVIAIVVCCGVPGLFLSVCLLKLKYFGLGFRFRLPEANKKINKE